jgi:hypothetical protein
MPYIVLANRLAFQPTKPGEPTMPDGPEQIVHQGESVPDYVPTYVTAALASAGNVVWTDRSSVELFQPEPIPAQVRTPDQPVVLPSDPNGEALTVGDLTPDAPVQDTPVTEAPPSGDTEIPAEPLPPLPKAADNKDVWENYATRPQIGMTLGEAEAMNKKDLMAEVTERHNAATK